MIKKWGIKPPKFDFLIIIDQNYEKISRAKAILAKILAQKYFPNSILNSTPRILP